MPETLQGNTIAALPDAKVGLPTNPWMEAVGARLNLAVLLAQNHFLNLLAKGEIDPYIKERVWPINMFDLEQHVLQKPVLDLPHQAFIDDSRMGIDPSLRLKIKDALMSQPHPPEFFSYDTCPYPDAIVAFAAIHRLNLPVPNFRKPDEVEKYKWLVNQAFAYRYHGQEPWIIGLSSLRQNIFVTQAYNQYGYITFDKFLQADLYFHTLGVLKPKPRHEGVKMDILTVIRRTWDKKSQAKM